MKQHRPILLHIGLHKTATTSMQQHIFPMLNKWSYVSRDDLLTHESLGCIYKYMMGMVDKLEGVDKIPSDVPFLISDEWLLSSYDPLKRNRSMLWLQKLTRIADFVSSYPGKVLIVITTRAPTEALWSYYLELKREYKELSRISFTEFANSECAKVYNPFLLQQEFLKYNIVPIFIDFDKKEVFRFQCAWEAVLAEKIPAIPHANANKSISYKAYIKSPLHKAYLDSRLARFLVKSLHTLPAARLVLPWVKNYVFKEVEVPVNRPGEVEAVKDIHTQWSRFYDEN